MKVKNLYKKFRILKGWNVIQSRSKKYLAQSTSYPLRKETTIYQWGSCCEMPKDYVLHEALHAAFSALLSMDRRSPKEIRQAEEELIQDICAIKLHQQ